MALTRPRGFEGQVRGVSHHGQETHLQKQAGYIDADFLHPPTFPLQSDGGPYIEQVRFSTCCQHDESHSESLAQAATMCRPGLEPALTAPRVPLTGLWPYRGRGRKEVLSLSPSTHIRAPLQGSRPQEQPHGPHTASNLRTRRRQQDQHPADQHPNPPWNPLNPLVPITTYLRSAAYEHTC